MKTLKLLILLILTLGLWNSGVVMANADVGYQRDHRCENIGYQADCQLDTDCAQSHGQLCCQIMLNINGAIQSLSWLSRSVTIPVFSDRSSIQRGYAKLPKQPPKFI